MAQTSYGTVYGDAGADAPYLQSLSPADGPKQGGTRITVQGAGFQNDERLTCRFARLNPNTEMTVTKTTSASYVSPTEIVCDSPEWEEDACPTCGSAVPLKNGANNALFMGHTGSRYLRTDSTSLIQQIGVGDYIKMAAATVGSGTPLVQYFEIDAIEQCSGEGCVCTQPWTSNSYQVTRSFNGTGAPSSIANEGFEIITATNANCALYRYDVFTGGARDANSPNLERFNNPAYGYLGTTSLGAECTTANLNAACGASNWGPGTKVTLSEPIYKIPGTANVQKGGTQAGLADGFVAYRASKFSCTGCKCAGGCEVTVSVTNDGKKFSGSGLGGKVWAGSGLSFSLRDVVPTVQYIDLGLPGYRDSTRIFGPASGGTTITVVGENFQDSPLLRCYFAGVKTMVKAEWISSTKVRCKTPDFFSRQLDGSMVASNQDGSAKNPHSKVHVTNDGILMDSADGSEHISRNPFLADDGSKAYIKTFDAANTYNSGMSGHNNNPFRSTCQQGLYPNEGMAPCYGAHVDLGVTAIDRETDYPDPDGSGSNWSPAVAYSAGNDVLFKYATCYDSIPAGLVTSLDLYTGTTTGFKYINQTCVPGQKFTISGADNMDGPLSRVELHLEKASKESAVLEVSISAGNFRAYGGSLITFETITVSQIDAATDYKYNVFFQSPPYLLSGTPYYMDVKWVSGAIDTQWKYTNGGTPNGYYAHLNYPIYYNFKFRGYTCDGCRTKMKYEPSGTNTLETRKFGSWNSTQESGGSTYLTHYAPAPPPFYGVTSEFSTYRSMLAQEFRPSETGTITHAYLKIKNDDVAANNGIDQAYVSIWITQYGKYGEYVCSVYGGNQLASTCDTNMDGTFGEACRLGAVCDPNLGLNGGCGDRGACTLAETVMNGHVLRPGTGQGAAGECGPSEECALTSTLVPDHQKKIENQLALAWSEFEFAMPVPVEKHTTYFLNAAVVGNPDISKPIVWASGKAHGDGGVNDRTGTFVQGGDASSSCDSSRTFPAGAACPPPPPGYTPAPAPIVDDELRYSYTRDVITWKWHRNTQEVLATKFTRCVSSTAQVHGFATSGEKTGCCNARASPQGGDKGAMVTITGRNFFPSDDLRCVFRNEGTYLESGSRQNPSMLDQSRPPSPPGSSIYENFHSGHGVGGSYVPAEVLDASYTMLRCKAPTQDPHASRDCTNPGLCQGTELLVSNDGFTVGPQFMGPKWKEPTATSALPAYLGLNPMKFLFTDIFVSPSGSDTVGDGTIARPYQTIQRGVDAANEYDQLQLLPGTYTGLGNRGLRHHGKKIQLQSYKMRGEVTADGNQYNTDGDVQNTIIDCQHAPDGFILNNNKDSDSPFAGYIDTQGIITRNCENLRIYDI
jgi:hypothetical protein